MADLTVTCHVSRVLTSTTARTYGLVASSWAPTCCPITVSQMMSRVHSDSSRLTQYITERE